jgi:hypothetical protein
MPRPDPSAATLKALLRRLGRHEPDLADLVFDTTVAQQGREQRERDAAWRAGGQSLVRALQQFRARNPHRHWEDYAYGGGRRANSIGLAMNFLGSGGIPKKDLEFVKRVVDQNDPPTRTWELNNLLGDPLAKESEHTVLLALYSAATLGYDIMDAGAARKVKEYSQMLNDKYRFGWGHGGSLSAGSTQQVQTRRRGRKRTRRGRRKGASKRGKGRSVTRRTRRRN